MIDARVKAPAENNSGFSANETHSFYYSPLHALPFSLSHFLTGLFTLSLSFSPYLLPSFTRSLSCSNFHTLPLLFSLFLYRFSFTYIYSHFFLSHSFSHTFSFTLPLSRSPFLLFFTLFLSHNLSRFLCFPFPLTLSHILSFSHTLFHALPTSFQFSHSPSITLFLTLPFSSSISHTLSHRHTFKLFLFHSLPLILTSALLFTDTFFLAPHFSSSHESIRTLRGTFDCRQEGDLWIIEAGFENKPELKKVYKFTPGVPFEDIDIFGRKFKMIANLEGDKLRDQITDWANSVVENIREVKDGVMYCTTTCNGVTTELKFHRP
ncbi:FABP7 [Acanthosepion pharaonis]|uniref:FABP7 n=1 Tax=Acanthosepion pharaonis TaxID=158019 RepID=A0A812AR30_ACAPH|nr:FABP7 [Sepia pharaonis]